MVLVLFFSPLRKLKVSLYETLSFGFKILCSFLLSTLLVIASISPSVKM